LDTNRHVGVNYHPEKEVNPKAILMTAIGPKATQEDKKTFPKRFQNMVKKLFEQPDRVIEVIEFSASSQKDQDTHE
jgi:GTP cyclohydrolase I